MSDPMKYHSTPGSEGVPNYLNHSNKYAAKVSRVEVPILKENQVHRDLISQSNPQTKIPSKVPLCEAPGDCSGK